MIKMIRKDLILHKKFVLWMAILYPLYLGYLGSRVNNTNLLPIFSCLLYAIVPLILFGREDKFKSEAFGLSLPVSRREYLGARFLLSWGLMLLMFLAGSVLMAVVPGAKLSAATIFGSRTILLSLAFLSLYFGFLMPLHVRFGYAGLLVLLVALQVIGILLMAFRKAIGIGMFKKILHLIPDGIAAVQSWLGPAASVPAVLGVLALFSYGSFALSLALFRRKEY